MKRGLLGVALGLAAVLNSAASHAEASNGWEVGPESGNTGCILAKVMPGGEVVGIRQSASGGQYYMIFSSANWDSLRPRVNQRMPIELLFSTANGDRRIVDSDAVIIATNAGDEGVIGIWNGAEAAVLRDLVEQARNVTLIGEGKEIGTYPMPADPQAFARLDACVAGLPQAPR